MSSGSHIDANRRTEQPMNLRDIAVATIAWARTEAEADLLERSLEVLLGLELPVVVADRGAASPFLARFRGRPNLHVAPGIQDGMISQVRESLTRAAQRGTRFILYTEPDKLQFFASGLRDFIATAPDDDDIGIVLAGRTASGMETFPSIQRYTEGVINELCHLVIGVAAD